MVNSIAMTWDVNKRHKGHKIRAKTKMLTRQQKAIIRYCFTEGIPARDLAEKYARSPTRIYQIQWEPEFKIFGTDDEKSWFLAGVEAAISVQRAKMVVPEPANRLLQAREACRKVRQDLYSRRAKNLPNFAQQDRQIREEGIAEEEDIAEEEGIEIRLHNIIYKMVEEIETAMKGMLAPEIKEVITGQAEIRQVIKVSKVGNIAGCYVTDGFIRRNCGVRLIRDGVVVYEGKLGSLKRFQDDVKEVTSGFECGLSIENFNDIKEGDIVEGYIMEEVEVK